MSTEPAEVAAEPSVHVSEEQQAEAEGESEALTLEQKILQDFRKKTDESARAYGKRLLSGEVLDHIKALYLKKSLHHEDQAYLSQLHRRLLAMARKRTEDARKNDAVYAEAGQEGAKDFEHFQGLFTSAEKARGADDQVDDATAQDVQLDTVQDAPRAAPKHPPVRGKMGSFRAIAVFGSKETDALLRAVPSGEAHNALQRTLEHNLNVREEIRQKFKVSDAEVFAPAIRYFPRGEKPVDALVAGKQKVVDKAEAKYKATLEEDRKIETL